MKLKGIIVNELSPQDKSNVVHVKFNKDPNKQVFEIVCDFNPFSYRMRKWDIWTFDVKWESEQYIDIETGAIRYRTVLRCGKATENKNENK